MKRLAHIVILASCTAAALAGKLCQPFPGPPVPCPKLQPVSFYDTLLHVTR